MTLDIRDLKARAAALAETNRAPARTLVLWFCGVLAALTLGSNGLNLYLDSQIGRTGGLEGIGMRSLLQTVQTILSYINQFFGPFWTAGFLAAMLAMVRGIRPKPRDLTEGFRRPLRILGYVAFEAAAALLLLVAVVNLSSILFTLSPMGADFAENMAPLLLDAEALTPEGLLNQELISLDALIASLLPMFVITGVLYLPLFAVMAYGFRLALYLVMDRGIGAIPAHFLSLRLMRGHKLQMLRLDLSWWWYYLLGAVCYAVAYLPTVLLLLGVGLPMDYTAMLFVSLAVYCGLYTLLCLWRKPMVDASYVLAYEALLPKAPETPAE